jgi:hypothetical protein
MWYSLNKDSLAIINYGTWKSSPCTTIDDFILCIDAWALNQAVVIPNSFEVGSKIWVWFATYMQKEYGIDLFVTTGKVGEAAFANEYLCVPLRAPGSSFNKIRDWAKQDPKFDN